jgi:hypothetical protein
LHSASTGRGEGFVDVLCLEVRVRLQNLGRGHAVGHHVDDRRDRNAVDDPEHLRERRAALEYNGVSQGRLEAADGPPQL